MLFTRADIIGLEILWALGFIAGFVFGWCSREITAKKKGSSS